MKPVQQRFWPDAQPLVERLGRDFFRQLPETPGVYQMRGGSGIVLYVGKARNLRRRLCSYRVANPERMARRTLRLLNQVKNITWEECRDETAALRREAELLLEIKPRFNRTGVWRGTDRFLAWRYQRAGLELAVVESVETEWSGAGSFGARAIHLHRALVRLLWCRLNPKAGLAGMPAGWFHGEHGARVLISPANERLAVEAREHLASLVEGDGERFCQWLGPATFRFEEPMREEDLELVMKHIAGRFASTLETSGGSSLSRWGKQF